MKETQKNLLQRAGEWNHLDSSKKKIIKNLFYKLLPQSEKTNLKRKYDKLQGENESNDGYQTKKFKLQDQKNTNAIEVEEKKPQFKLISQDSLKFLLIIIQQKTMKRSPIFFAKF